MSVERAGDLEKAKALLTESVGALLALALRHRLSTVRERASADRYRVPAQFQHQPQITLGQDIRAFFSSLAGGDQVAARVAGSTKAADSLGGPRLPQSPTGGSVE